MQKTKMSVMDKDKMKVDGEMALSTVLSNLFSFDHAKNEIKNSVEIGFHSDVFYELLLKFIIDFILRLRYFAALPM